MKKEKKAEVSMSWIIIIILTLLGFAILILVYRNIDWGGKTLQELCHESIVFRATLPFGAAYVPLKCPTQKICIVAHSSAKCPDLEGEQNVQKEKVKTKEDIEKIIAEAMVDCWRMTGEGKLGIFPKGFIDSLGAGQIESSCLICTRIAMNIDDLRGAGIDIENLDVNYYMEHENVPGQDLTYDDYFSNNGRTKISVSESVKFNIVDPETDRVLIEGTAEEISGVQETSNNQDVAVLFMQIPTIEYGEALLNGLAALGISAGATYTLPPLKWTVGRLATTAVKAVGIKVASAVFLLAAGATIAVQQMNVASQRSRVATHCEDVMSGGEKKSGCSVLRVIDYKPSDINHFCDTVESIP